MLWVSGEGGDTVNVEETDDEPQQGQTPKEDRMREHTGPQINGTGPDDLAQLEGVLQQLQQTLEDHDDDSLWAPLQVTHEASALAQSLLHGWQVQQAMTQVWLRQWQQTLQALETVDVVLQR